MELPGLLLVAIGLLAHYRLSRAVFEDYVFDRQRLWIIDRVGEKIAYLIRCAWCASMYTGWPVWAPLVVWPTNRVVLIVVLVAAGSTVNGLIRQWWDPPDDLDEIPADD